MIGCGMSFVIAVIVAYTKLPSRLPSTPSPFRIPPHPPLLKTTLALKPLGKFPPGPVVVLTRRLTIGVAVMDEP